MRAWTHDEIRRIGYQVVDLIADHLSTLPEKPVFQPVPPDLQQQFLSTPAPADGVSPDEVLRAFQETVEPYPFGNGHPRFWGWVNSPPAKASKAKSAESRNTVPRERCRPRTRRRWFAFTGDAGGASTDADKRQASKANSPPTAA